MQIQFKLIVVKFSKDLFNISFVGAVESEWERVKKKILNAVQGRAKQIELSGFIHKWFQSLRSQILWQWEASERIIFGDIINKAARKNLQKKRWKEEMNSKKILILKYVLKTLAIQTPFIKPDYQLAVDKVSRSFLTGKIS